MARPVNTTIYKYPPDCVTVSERLAYRRFLAVLNALFTGSTDETSPPYEKDTYAGARTRQYRMSPNRLKFIAYLHRMGLDIAGKIPKIRNGEKIKLGNPAEILVKNQKTKIGAYRKKKHIMREVNLQLSPELVILKTRMIEADREYSQFRKQWAWINYVNAANEYWQEFENVKLTLPLASKNKRKKKKTSKNKGGDISAQELEIIKNMSNK